MELPITKPSKVSYADELEFSELLEQMSEKEYNGFIRITHGSEEGYILFKDGIQVAASYDRHLKNDALEKIIESMEKTDTLIEVFDLRLSQVDYLVDLNKAYKLEPISTTETTEPEPVTKEEYSQEYSGYNDAYFNPKEASYRKSVDELRAEEDLAYERRMAAEQPTQSPESESVVEPEPEPEPEVEIETISEPVPEPVIEKEISEPEPEKSKPETETASEEPEIESESVSSISSKSEAETETSTPTIEEPEEIETVPEVETEVVLEPESESALNSTETETNLDVDSSINIDELEEEVSIPADRSELMKKYGLKDIQEEEVDQVLETYKGGTVSSADLERIELTIMNRVKQSVMGIPKIKGVEVIVFLENTRELGGKIKIIAEYEGKGLFSRIMGDSKAVDNLKFQILEITEMEIRKSFREYPQIVENFDIGIEIH